VKRLYTAISILIALIAAGAASLWHADYSCDILSAQVEHIQANTLGDAALRAREVQKLVDLWSGRKDWLMHHVRHDSMDEIGSALSRAVVYARGDDTLHLQAELAELYWLFHGLRENEAVTLDNIL
jgi:hypothetical protein